jgi:hypothetical protein
VFDPTPTWFGGCGLGPRGFVQTVDLALVCVRCLGFTSRCKTRSMRSSGCTFVVRTSVVSSHSIPPSLVRRGCVYPHSSSWILVSKTGMELVRSVQVR